MSEINIDDLQREISAAEIYLKQQPSAAATRSSSSFGRFRGSKDSLDKAENSNKEEVNLSDANVGSESATAIGTDIMQLNRITLRSQREEIDGNRKSDVDYMHPSALRSSLGSHQSHHSDSSPNRSTGTPLSPYTNKYDDPKERDKLIAKLLDEHGRSGGEKKNTHSETSSLSPARLSGSTGSPMNRPSSRTGRYQEYEEKRQARERQESLDSVDSHGSYSAAFNEGANEGMESIGFKGNWHGYSARQENTSEDTLFFASDLNASMGSTGSRESRLPSDEKILRAELRQARGMTDSMRSKSSGQSSTQIIFGSYDGEEDAAMYLPEPDESNKANESTEGATDDMLATAKAVHSSADPPSILGHHDEHQPAAHVAWADEQQAAVSSSIPVLRKVAKAEGVSNVGFIEKKSTGAGVTRGKIQPQQRPTSTPTPTASEKKLAAPPSRLQEPRNKEWKYVKSKEQCEEEGKQAARRDGHGEYSFQPKLSAKVRKQNSKVAEEGRRKSVVSAMFNNLPMPEEEPKNKDDHSAVELLSKEHSKFDIKKVDESIRHHQQKQEARVRLKQHVENMEVQSCSFKPTISKKAQEMAAQARVQQLALLQEEQIASHYFDKDALPRRLDPNSIDDVLNMGQNGYALSSDGGYIDREGPGNPFAHLAEDEHGNLVYDDMIVEDPYAHHLGEQVSERLHQEAHTRQEQQRWLEQKVREARAAEHSFQPVITTGTSKHYDKLKKDYGVDHIPIHERIGELQKVKQKRMQDLRAALEEDEGRTYTFNPSIDKKSRELADRRRKEDEKHRLAELQRAAFEQQQRQDDELISEKGHSRGHKPRHMGSFSSAVHSAMVDSNNDNKGPSNSGLGDATQAALERFFSEEGEKSVEQREADLQAAVTEEVSDRLLKEGRATDMKMMYLQVMREREIEEQCKPAGLSKGTTRYIEESPFVGASFAERQRMYQEKVKQRQMHRQEQVEEKTRKWFHPHIGSATRVVAASNPKMLVESKTERTERLSKHHAQTKQDHVKALGLEVYKDVTFQPKILKKSRQLAPQKGSSLEDLVENPKGKAVREEVRKRVQEEENRTNTFKPTIPQYRPEHGHYDESEVTNSNIKYNKDLKENKSNNSSSRADPDPYAELYGDDLPRGNESGFHDDVVHNSYGVDDSFAKVNQSTVSASVQLRQSINMKEPEKMARSIRQDLQRKEERRRMAVVKTELRELEQCTFKPAVIPYGGDQAGRDGKPVVIPGLDRHLELKEMTKKKKDDEKRREDDVFSVRGADSMRKPEDGTTIQKPFHLSESDKRPSRAILELQEKEKNDLTFNPYTQNAARRNEHRRAARAHAALHKDKKSTAASLYK